MFQELCLYTLGNLVVESKAVRKQLLPQGIIPVLASCIQVGEIAQSHSSPALPQKDVFSYALEMLADSTELPALLPAVATGRDPSAEGCSPAGEDLSWALLHSIFGAQVTTLCSSAAECLTSITAACR